MLYIWGHYPAPPSTFLTNHLSKAPVLLTIYCLWVAILLVGDTQLYLAMSVHQWVCQSVYWSIGWEYWNLVGLVDCVLGKDIKVIDHFHFSGSESGIKSFRSHISSFRSLLGESETLLYRSSTPAQTSSTFALCWAFFFYHCSCPNAWWALPLYSIYLKW